MDKFTTNELLTNFFYKNKNKLKKSVIIMDEVDGMTGDRGGIQELVKWIKKSS